MAHAPYFETNVTTTQAMPQPYLAVVLVDESQQRMQLSVRQLEAPGPQASTELVVAVTRVVQAGDKRHTHVMHMFSKGRTLI